MKMSTKIAIALLALSGGASVSTSRAADESRFVGTWRLIEFYETEVGANAPFEPMGHQPLGLVTFTADGRMSLIISSSDRKAPTAPKATDSEAALLFRSMIAYAGSYKVDGNKLRLMPDISSNQTWNGTEQTREFTFEEAGGAIDCVGLRWRTPPFASPLTGKQSVGSLRWNRICP